MPLPPSMRRFRDENGRLRLAALVGAAHFPVYGLDDHPFGLTFGLEVGFSWADKHLASVTLSFVHGPVGQADWVHLPLDVSLANRHYASSATSGVPMEGCPIEKRRGQSSRRPHNGSTTLIRLYRSTPPAPGA